MFLRNRLTVIALAGMVLFSGCQKSSEDAKEKKGAKSADQEKKGSAGDDLQSQYDKARSLESKGEYAAAYKIFKEIEKAKPDYKDIATRVNDYPEILEILVELKESDGDVPSIRAALYVQLAQELKKRGSDYTAGAKAQYNKALELDSESFEAHYELADLQLKDGRYKDALTHFQKACEVGSEEPTRTAMAHHQLATILSTLEPEEGGDSKKALASAKKAVSLAGPKDLKSRRLLIELLDSSGAKKDALQLAEQVAKMKGATDEDKARVTELKGE